MKKSLLTVVAAMLLIGTFIACSKTDDVAPRSNSNGPSVYREGEDQFTGIGNLVGFAGLTSIEKVSATEGRANNASGQLFTIIKSAVGNDTVYTLTSSTGLNASQIVREFDNNGEFVSRTYYLFDTPTITPGQQPVETEVLLDTTTDVKFNGLTTATRPGRDGAIAFAFDQIDGPGVVGGEPTDNGYSIDVDCVKHRMDGDRCRRNARIMANFFCSTMFNDDLVAENVVMRQNERRVIHVEFTCGPMFTR